MIQKLSQSINLRGEVQTAPAWFTVAVNSAASSKSMGRLKLFGNYGQTLALDFCYDHDERKGGLVLAEPRASGDPDYCPTKARLVVNNGQGEIQFLFPGRPDGGWLGVGELVVDCDGLMELIEDPSVADEPQTVLAEVSL